MNDSGILPPCPACADSAVWSCFTPRSDLRQRRDKAWHSALWLMSVMSHVMLSVTDEGRLRKYQNRKKSFWYFFSSVSFCILFFIWCRKTGRFDGWNHKCIMKLQTLDKIFVVTSSFFIGDVILQFPSHRNATAQRLGLTMVYPMWH